MSHESLLERLEAWQKFVVTTDAFDGEHCKVCRCAQARPGFVRWIFCKSCGESFHQNCAADAPSEDHPSNSPLGPRSFNYWDWQCQACRRCQNCPQQTKTRKYACYQCKTTLCEECDPLPTAPLGGYYYSCCRKCRKDNSRKCIQCRKDFPCRNSRSASLFCLACRRWDACPRCKIRYAPTDYSTPMIACDGCKLWIHIVCAGIPESAYGKLGHSKVKFYCAQCSNAPMDADKQIPDLRPPPAYECDLKNLKPTPLKGEEPVSHESSKIVEGVSYDSLWLRSGLLAIKIPQKVIHDHSLILHLRHWHLGRRGERTTLELKLGFTADWRIKAAALSHEGRIVCWRSSLLALKLDLSRLSLQIPLTESEIVAAAMVFLKPLYIKPLPFKRPILSSVPIKLQHPPLDLPVAGLEDETEASQSNISTGHSVGKENTMAKAPLVPKSSAKICKPLNNSATVTIFKRQGTHGTIDVDPANEKFVACDFGCARTREYRKVWQRPQPIKVIPSPEQERVSSLIAAINRQRSPSIPSLVVARSQIAGLGLYTNKSIPAGFKVIEYCGELIGQMVADRREIHYSLLPLKRHDCYLFRLNEDCIIDATVRSNQARFINHSCSPNCESRVEKNRIVIYAIRDIVEGEELSYDYKFSREKDEAPISCYCGALNCRGVMN